MTKLTEINGTEDLIIAVAGENEVEAQDISVTADSGNLEILTEPNMLAEEPASVEYLFNFTDEMGVDTIRLTAGNKLIYQLVLFSVPEENKTIVFGIDAEALAASQSQPQQKISEPEIAGIKSTSSNEADPKTLLPLPEQTIVPYAERTAHEKAQSLKFCPVGISLITPKEFLTKESKGREVTFSGSMIMEMGTNSVIVVDSDITSNTVWTADNTYHVTTDINVQALLVIEPGTVVSFAYDTAMFINNGGTLISCGTPDNSVIYTSDSGTPGYSDYYCPIYIEETASVSTKITYCYIEYAYIGIMMRGNGLDSNIENNYLYHNVYGIVEFGTEHTNISNNLIFESYYSGIEVFLESITGQADANSHILIQNNTCDYYQDCGITIHGVPDINDAGTVVLANNIVSGSYQYGLALVDYYMYATVTNTGYFDNANNKNWEFEESNPVIETEWPYRDGTGWLPVCYLTQNCDFIDAGHEYIEETHLIGKTTDVNSLPDSNYTDIGFHYPNWNFSNPGSGDTLSADMDDSMRVDFNDFAIFANYWQQSTSGVADLDNSGFVDYNDLSILAGQWLQVADPNIEIQIYGDSNNGYVDIGISGFTSDTQRVFLIADGKYVGEIFGFSNGYTLTMDISESGGQEQELKAISISNSGQVTCSNITDATFSCPLNYCFVPSSYEPNKPLYFSALNSSAEDVSVNVYADCGNLVWSQIYSGNSIFGSIPAEITSQHEIDYISFDTSGGELLGMSGGGSITKITDPVEPDLSFDVKALIILPDLRIILYDFRSIWAVQTAFKNRGIKYKKLSLSSANYDNIALYAMTNPIKYMYVDTHGNYRLVSNGVLRTCVKLYDGIAVSIKQSDFAPSQAPSWCQRLEGSLETTTKSFFSMGFNSLEFAYFDCCYSGHLKINANNELIEGQPGQIGLFDGPHSDMSLALGIGETSRSRVYQGWYGLVPSRLWPFESEYQKWTRLEWMKLGEGEDLYSALMYVISQQTEFGPNDPVNNYRLKGQGLMTDIKLSEN